MAKKPPPLWTMRDGTKIAIADMSDSHLHHTIKYIERNAQKFADRLYLELSQGGGPSGDMAYDEAMGQLLAGEFEIGEVCEHYDFMVAEQERREKVNAKFEKTKQASLKQLRRDERF